MAYLTGMRALVTGGSRGIGLAIAEAFARAGAELCLAATDRARLETARTGITDAVSDDAMAEITLADFDVTDRAACLDAVVGLTDRWGRIDILVNCAGAYRASRFLDYDIEDIDRLMQVNYFGTVHMMQSALPGMQARGFGRVINIASTAGKWGSANQSAYNASKHAVVGITRSVALEMAAAGVTVNAICPGLVDTDLGDALVADHAEINGVSTDAMMQAILARIPGGRLIQPAEVAELAVYLARRESGGMTGQSLLYDGGMLMV
ncbi:MAG: SDR family oxidoreductase [Rhodospirillaceae bacterium]|nr:SDR family oxidoreductase [Rhodospirillaceae bacterium]MBT5943395.1 SDR family oxidoreductase [Rhodospirillaceae bacterium]